MFMNIEDKDVLNREVGIETNTICGVSFMPIEPESIHGAQVST